MRNKLICSLGAVTVLMAVSFSARVMAADQVGTLTEVSGDVKIFTHPSKTLQKNEAPGSAPHALYEKEYYVVENAKVGLRVDQGNIVRTAPNAKARIIFNNGDQINVGPATAFRIFWDKDSLTGSTRMDLAYGKVRGIIEKGGPRSKLMIRTKTATMGVRGTDFFIADGGVDGGTEVSIIRGAVEVKSKAVDAKPVQVKSGFSAAIPAIVPTVVSTQAVKTQVASVVPAVELRKTTQEELNGIQRSSVIPAAPVKEGEAAPVKSAAIVLLEKKAVETTIKDIKVGDPKLFAQLEKTSFQSTDQINAQAIQVLVKEAPRAPESRKPYKSEIDNLEEGAYEKYFKITE